MWDAGENNMVCLCVALAWDSYFKTCDRSNPTSDNELGKFFDNMANEAFQIILTSFFYVRYIK